MYVCDNALARPEKVYTEGSRQILRTFFDINEWTFERDVREDGESGKINYMCVKEHLPLHFVILLLPSQSALFSWKPS